MNKRKCLVRYISVLTASLLAGCTASYKSMDFDKFAYDANQRIEKIIAEEEPITAPISLYEAMARALKYNLDKRIEFMEESYRIAQYELSQTGMLPQVVASLSRRQRSNDAGSSSRSLLDGSESLQSSTSSDRGSNTGDLTASWDILDFGFSYVQSKQNHNQRLIAVERERKVINRILEDVRTVYWRAVSADRTHKKLVKLESQAQVALLEAEQLEQRRQISPLQVLIYQRDLLQIQRRVQRMQRELLLAKKQLAALMNIRPNAQFKLVLPNRTDLVPELPGSAEQMVLLGLKFRPELREALYRKRINKEELNKIFIKNLPSVKAILGFNYDSNSYLYNNSWYEGSLQVSWNLMNLFRYPLEKATIKAQSKVLQAREDALTMAIMTQVYISRARFIRLSQELNTVRRAHDVQKRILSLTRIQYNVNMIGQHQLIREEMNSIEDEVQYDTAYADLQNAYANLYASMGIDTVTRQIKLNSNIKQLADTLRTKWTEELAALPNISYQPQEKAQ